MNKMNLLSDIRLKWYDDTSLLQEDRRKLIELFLDSIGVSREVASDLFEVLVIARSESIALTSAQIKEKIIELRETRGQKADSGLSNRNIQIWLKFFKELDMVEKIGARYLFSGNKKPSEVFSEKTKQTIIDPSIAYIERVLKKIESEYSIE